MGLMVGFMVALALTSPFGEAEARAISVSGGLTLEVSVEVEGAPVAVLVRGIGLVDELPPVALAPQGNGLWAGIVELPSVTNIRIGFESIPASGASTVSDLHLLTELGVDPAIFEASAVQNTPRSPQGAVDVPAGDQEWGWLGLAAGAAGLSLLAFWTLGSGRRRSVDNLSGNADDSTNADEPEAEAATSDDPSP